MIYAAVLLVIGFIVTLMLPIQSSRKGADDVRQGVDRGRERQKPGALRCELDCLLAETEASIQHRGPDLEHAVSASW